MYIDADMVIKASSLLAAIGALIGAIIAVYKQIEANKKQSETIRALQTELTIVCYVHCRG